MPSSPERIEALRRIARFCEKPEQELAHLLEVSVWEEYAPQQLIFDAGESGSSFWLLVSGRVAATLGRGADVRVLADIPPGEMIGAPALYRREVLRTNRMIAFDRSVLLRMETSILAALAARGSSLEADIEDIAIESLTSRIRWCNEVIKDELRPQGGFAQTLRKLRDRLRGEARG